MTELSFAREVCDAVAQTWRPTPDHKMIVNLPATVEAAMPNVFADQVEWMDRNMGYRDSIVLSVHPHNDRGTAVAAAELAMLAGADRVEGCLFGNGERTGNVDLVTLAMNLYTQGIDPGLDFSDIDGVRRVVERCNQIAGASASSVCRRSRVHGVLGLASGCDPQGLSPSARPDAVWEVPYLPIDPADLGRSYDAVIRVNSQSGKGGATYLLERGLGFTPPRRVQIEFSHAVQKVADASGAEVSGEAICALFKREYFDAQGPASRADASTLRFDGRHVKLPVSAVADETHAQAVAAAVASVAGVAIEVTSFETAATAKGETAVFVGCRIGDQAMRFGVAVHANAAQAVADAIVSAVNRVRWAGRKEMESEAVAA